MSPGRQGLRDLITRTPRITLPTVERQRRNTPAQGNPESPRVSGYLLPTPESWGWAGTNRGPTDFGQAWTWLVSAKTAHV